MDRRANDARLGMVMPADGDGEPVELIRTSSPTANPTEDTLVMWLDDGALGETRAGSMRSSDLWGTVQVWPPRGRGTPFPLVGHESRIYAVALDPKRRRVAASASDGTVRIWPIDWDLLIRQLRSATTACLEPAERERLLGETATEALARFSECERRNGRS